MTIGPGWKFLLNAVEDFLKFRDGKIIKVATGNGGMTILYDCDYDVHNVISAAETMAGIMCEECGKPASCHEINDEIRTVCEEHLLEWKNRTVQTLKKNPSYEFQHVWTVRI